MEKERLFLMREIYNMKDSGKMVKDKEIMNIKALMDMRFKSLIQIRLRSS